MFQNVQKYFSASKHKPKKQINAEIPKEDRENIKEFAMFLGCPQGKVEQALVQYAVDQAMKEVQGVRQTEEF